MPKHLSKQETRDRVERFTSIVNELARRQKAAECEASLLEFVRTFWHILEPETKLVEGWPLAAMCQHLEAVTSGEIKRLLINISPGSMKSLLVNCFWPAWEWIKTPHLRYVTFSYAAHLTERDNNRFLQLVNSPEYRTLYGQRFKLVKTGQQNVSNDKTGWKVASSVGGVGTGERGDRVICFPYDTKIMTSAGQIQIGDIVKNKLPVQIAGFDHEKQKQVWRTIESYQRNPAGQLIEVVHASGKFRCTSEHPIFVLGRGYVAAHDLKAGDILQAAQQGHPTQAISGENVLLAGEPAALENSAVIDVKDAGFAAETFNLSVSEVHNYFADGVLVHNCDDPHNVKQRESEKVRNDTIDWFASAMSNRLNDLDKGAIVVIMQRVHQEDVSGFILSKQLGYVHLMIPAEYEADRHCRTSIGWEDPRTVDGELFWPERISQMALRAELGRMGPYDYAGQYQQRPAPKGGAIFKDEWWQYYEMPYHGEFPVRFEYIVASLDTAYGTNQGNDYSALTVWGVWRQRAVEGLAEFEEPKIMLIDGWQKKISLHGSTVGRFDAEPDNQKVAMEDWGLVEWVAYTCNKRKVDRLLIEAKASGLSVADEMRRLYAREGWAIELVDPRGDKVARAHSVVPTFSDWLVYVPASFEGGELLPYQHASELMEQAETFPRSTHDDLVDTMTQALQHLRRTGLAIRREEYRHDLTEAMRYRPNPEPLYQV